MKSKLKSNSSFTILVGVISLLLAFVGITAAYFSITVTGNNEASSIVTNTVNLGNITFTDGNEINAVDIYPGWYTTKTFTVANTKDNANDQISYAILLYVETNTITEVAEGAFEYSLDGTSTNGGTTISLFDWVPDYEGQINLLSDDGILNGEDTHTYTFTIGLMETDMDQNAVQGKSFKGIIQVDVATTTGYRTWDSVSGTWKPYLVPAPEECFEFNSSTGEITAYDYSNYDCPLAFAIPEEINGEPVTEIADYAFYGSGGGVMSYDETNDINKEDGVYYNNDINILNMVTSSKPKLTKVKIPDTVTLIGNYAFGRNSIDELILSNSLTTIGNYAFSNNNIDDLTLPSSLTTIGNNAFEINSLTNITIPNSVTTIGEGAFVSNSLTNITLSSSLTTIGIAAFYGNNISNITIPNSVSNINDYAFDYNVLTSICIKGKSGSASFTTYGTNIWGWAEGYSDSNITWNCTD